MKGLGWGSWGVRRWVRRGRLLVGSARNGGVHAACGPNRQDARSPRCQVSLTRRVRPGDWVGCWRRL